MTEITRPGKEFIEQVEALLSCPYQPLLTNLRIACEQVENCELLSWLEQNQSTAKCLQMRVQAAMTYDCQSAAVILGHLVENPTNRDLLLASAPQIVDSIYEDYFKNPAHEERKLLCCNVLLTPFPSTVPYMVHVRHYILDLVEGINSSESTGSLTELSRILIQNSHILTLLTKKEHYNLEAALARKLSISDTTCIIAALSCLASISRNLAHDGDSSHSLFHGSKAQKVLRLLINIMSSISTFSVVESAAYKMQSRHIWQFIANIMHCISAETYEAAATCSSFNFMKPFQTLETTGKSCESFGSAECLVILVEKLPILLPRLGQSISFLLGQLSSQGQTNAGYEALCRSLIHLGPLIQSDKDWSVALSLCLRLASREIEMTSTTISSSETQMCSILIDSLPDNVMRATSASVNNTWQCFEASCSKSHELCVYCHSSYDKASISRRLIQRRLQSVLRGNDVHAAAMDLNFLTLLTATHPHRVDATIVDKANCLSKVEQAPVTGMTDSLQWRRQLTEHMQTMALTQSNTVIEYLDTICRDLETKVSNIERPTKLLEAEIVNLRSMVSQIVNERDQLRRDFEEEKHTHTILQTSAETANAEHLIMTNKLNEAQSQIVDMEEQFERERSDLQMKCATAKSTLESVNIKVEHVTQTNAQLITEISEISSALQTEEDDNDRLQAEIRQIADLLKLSCDREALAIARSVELNEGYHALSNKHEGDKLLAAGEISRLLEQLRVKTEQHDNLSVSLSTSRMENESMSRSRAELEARLVEQQLEHAEYISVSENRIATLETTMQEQLKKSEQTIQALKAEHARRLSVLESELEARERQTLKLQHKHDVKQKELTKVQIMSKRLMAVIESDLDKQCTQESQISAVLSERSSNIMMKPLSHPKPAEKIELVLVDNSTVHVCNDGS